MAKSLSGGAASGGGAVRFNSIEDVDAKIKELETEMMTTSLSVAEEKKRMHQIQQLQTGKRAVAALSEQRSRVSQLKEANEMSRADLKTWQDELRSKTAALSELRDQEKQIEQQIDALRASAPSMQVRHSALLLLQFSALVLLLMCFVYPVRYRRKEEAYRRQEREAAGAESGVRQVLRGVAPLEDLRQAEEGLGLPGEERQIPGTEGGKREAKGNRGRTVEAKFRAQAPLCRRACRVHGP